MFKIGNKEISSAAEPFMIAELSGNHNGSIERAKLTIKAAKDAGADSVKLQTYTAETMTIDCDKPDFIIKNGLWSGNRLYDLYESAHTPYEWHKELFEFAKSSDVLIFSTPFNESAVDLLEDLNTPAYKIASFELTDLPLIKYAATTKKPLLMSTGMASEYEIEEAVDTALTSGCNGLLLFHCISSYPAPISEANLKIIKVLREKYNVEVGLSDHTIGNTAAISAVALGASAVEKHFTLDRSSGGPDSAFSIEPSELKSLINDMKDAWLSLGKNESRLAPSEADSLIFRRSLYFVRHLKSGQKISPDDIRRIRPGFGLAPKFLESIIGKTVNCDITPGDRVEWSVIE